MGHQQLNTSDIYDNRTQLLCRIRKLLYFRLDSSMPISIDRKKQFRTLGHKLKPVVTIAGNGLSPSVITELNRALDDHELIKVKLGIPEREDRKEIVAELTQLPNVELIQEIGKVVLLYRANKKPNPKLSNILRG